jgi:hypothetical protein
MPVFRHNAFLSASGSMIVLSVLQDAEKVFLWLPGEQVYRAEYPLNAVYPIVKVTNTDGSLLIQCCEVSLSIADRGGVSGREAE